MADNTQSAAPASGISFFGLLTVLFVGLKLTGFITWPWWQVTLPLWGPLVLVLAILALVLIGFVLVAGAAFAIAWIGEALTGRKAS